MFLVPCCDIRYDFCIKMISRLPFALYEVHVLFMVFTYIYVYWCPSRFPYQMMFVLVISNTAGVACRAGYPYLSSPQVFSGVCVARTLVFSEIFCILLFVLFTFCHCTVCSSSIYDF